MCSILHVECLSIFRYGTIGTLMQWCLRWSSVSIFSFLGTITLTHSKQSPSKESLPLLFQKGFRHSFTGNIKSQLLTPLCVFDPNLCYSQQRNSLGSIHLHSHVCCFDLCTWQDLLRSRTVMTDTAAPVSTSKDHGQLYMWSVDLDLYKDWGTCKWV